MQILVWHCPPLPVYGVLARRRETNKLRPLTMMTVTPELRDVATALLDKQKDEMDLSTMRMTTTRLLEANAALRRELEETQRHFADNNEYLKSESATKDEFSAIQGKQLRRLQVELEALRGDAAAELAELRGASEIEVETVRAERDSLAFELEQLRQFATLKQELDATLAERNKELADLRAQLAERTREVETRVLEAREHVQQDVARKVLQNQRDMEGEMQKRLDQTTVRTIDENNKVVAELRFQSHSSKRLLAENKRLAGDKSQLQHELENNEAMLKELSRRVRYYERLFAKLSQQRRTEMAQDLLEARALETASVVAAAAAAAEAAGAARAAGATEAAELPWAKRQSPESTDMLHGGAILPSSSLSSSPWGGGWKGGGNGNRNGMMGRVSNDNDDSSDGLGAVRGGQLREINDQLDAFLASRSVEPGGSSEGGSLLRSVRQYNELLMQRSSPNKAGGAVPVGRASGVGRGRRGAAAANRQSPRAARRLRGTGAVVQAKPRETSTEKGAANFGGIRR